MTELDRRRFLTAATATGASALAWPGHAAAAAADPAGVFVHGVASGDPTPDGAIIWTRVTPSADATPGSGLGPEIAVTWEVAADPGFSDIVARGVERTSAQRDHTVKVDVGGLRDGADHWYRFHTDSGTSPTGRLRTLPGPDRSPEELRIGVVTCAEWEFGFFGAYSRLAERDDVDLVLHLGDYVYEFGLGYGPASSPGADFGRLHEPTHETLTLADYRIRYGQYHTDAGAQALHAAHPMIVMYDDHEIANDVWRDGAQNHTDDEGDFATRARAARQAWREWLPIREAIDDPERVHRSLRFGDLAEMWIVDERRYRDRQVMAGPFNIGTVDPAIDDPDRTMLGVEQREWLLSGMAASTAAWKVVGNPVPMVPQNLGPELTAEQKLALEPLLSAAPLTRPGYYADDWNGYVGERNLVFAAFGEISDVVVLTGDYHESFASDLPRDVGGYGLDAGSVAVEFVTPAVTSPGNSETIARLGLPSQLASLVDVMFSTNNTLANPWVKFHDGFANGYGVASFTGSRVQFDFHFVVDRTDPATSAPVAASWAAMRGDPHVVPADAPLAGRPRTQPGGSGSPSTPSTAPTPAPGSIPPTGGGRIGPGIVAAGVAAAALAARRRIERPTP